MGQKTHPTGFRLGIIKDWNSKWYAEKGKYADFFLVPGDPTRSLKELRQIRMVVSDGVVYFPSEIYPWFGIRPFSEIPQVTGVVDTSVPGTATGN